MIQYEEELAIEVEITKPNFAYYLILDKHLKGCKEGTQQAQRYFQEALMIHNQEFYNIFMRLATRLFNEQEVLAKLIHLMHGVDDTFFDETNDDTPAFACIKEDKSKHQHSDLEQSIIQDLTAVVMYHIKFAKNQYIMYEQLLSVIHDEKAKNVLRYLKISSQEAFEILKNLLEILTTHTEIKEFGEGNSHESWDLDTSNYFDKPNPTFISNHKK
ncbi:MAG: hypothetical protein RSC10_09685 [Longicatena sp.]